MNFSNAKSDNASKAVLAIGLIVAVIGIVSLFLKWLVLDTQFLVDLSVIYPMLPTVPVPVDGYVNATGGTLTIPDDWHVVLPALTCVLPVIGAFLLVCSYFAPSYRKYIGIAIVILGLAAVVSACMFYVWEFDATVAIAKLAENPALAPYLTGVPGDITLGTVVVKDNIDIGFYTAAVAGVITAILGVVNTALHRD